MLNRAVDLLYQAKQNDIEIVLKEEQLHIRLPKGRAIDKILIEQLKINKQTLVDFIKSSHKPAHSLTQIERFDRDTVPYIPLSFSQERLFFIDQLEGSVQYHIPVVLRLSGHLNTTALENALQTIIHRHEVLRTIIRKHNGRGYQQITEKQWQLQTIDYVANGLKSNALSQQINELVQAPFNLGEDHMLRATLLKPALQEHVLVVVMHHIASDGWSMSVLVKELTELYNAFVANRPAQLAQPAIQYADYAVWQRNYLKEEVLDNKMAYWKKKLAGTAQLQLPTDYVRPAMQSSKGAIVAFEINRQLPAQLHTLARQHGATLFMTLLAAFKVLLYRYSGQQDICVGSPVANRSREVEDLIGFFVNTLALRTEVDGAATFTQLLEQVKTATLEAYQHQDVPFEKVVEAVVKERDISRSPLFQVMFTLQNTPDATDLRLADVQLARQPFAHVTSKFDITFTLIENSTGLHGSVEYSTGLFSIETIRRMSAHYELLLHSIIATPSAKIDSLSIVSEAEKSGLLNNFTDFPANRSDEKTILHLFDNQVAANASDTAIKFENQSLTFGQLNERSSLLASYLRGKGVQAETLVPVCLERGLEMLVAILGILKAGGAFVPIDPAYPQQRIRYMLEDVGAGLLISSRECSPKLTGITTAAIIEIDTDWETIQHYIGQAVESPVKSNQLIYVIYTSGSTGRPKGVMIEHGSVVNLLKSIASEIHFTERSVMLSVTTYTFDICYLEFFMPLITGGRLVIVPRATAMDGLRLAESIANYLPTHMQATPAIWQILLDEGWQNREGVNLLIGGEAVSEAIKENLVDKADVWNVYGPTETTIWSTGKKLEKGQKVLIGKPIANTGIYILSPGQSLCPAGITGEIYITGHGLARGYWNRAGLTAEKFVPDPFSQTPGARMYRTGDAGRWLPDGNLECLGRIDDQVKIRGNRIEPGEIETALAQSPLVSQAVVLARQNEEGFKSLISYYVPDEEAVRTKEKEMFEEQVANWKEVYETEYAHTGGTAEDEEFDIGIWNDSFTGQPIPSQQMQEWVADIVETIRPEHAGEVLEIGCGTGLIYYRLAGKVKNYIGTDFSRASINQINRRISKGLRNYGPTELLVSPAHETALPNGRRVDTIILNSIVQYFPGESYMDEVMKKCMSLLKEQGRIIIGDVRDLRLLPLFKSRLQLQKLKPSVGIPDMEWAVERETQREEELCFSPEYFYALQARYPQITYVDMQWKQSSYINELTSYRYNVVLYVGDKKQTISPQWQPWKMADKQNIIQRAQQGEAIIAIKDAPNPRLWQEQQISRQLQTNSATTVAGLVEAAARQSSESEAINEVLAKAQSLGYYCRLLLHQNPLLVNIVMERHRSEAFIESDFTEDNHNIAFTNIPLFDSISFSFQKEIRAFLQEKLPEYMVPSEFIALSRLPLTANGKTDRLFLSQRGDKETGNKLYYAPPVTELQQKLALIWQKLLGVERLGIQDNFFEAGGHSLLGMRLISAIRKELKVETTIHDLFTNPTIEALAGHIQLTGQGLLLPGLGIQQRPLYIPLSFSQERLFFIHQLEGSLQYHMPVVLRLSGHLNTAALENALQTIVRRHEVLRTVIRKHEGQGYQQVTDAAWSLATEDFTTNEQDTEVLIRHIQSLVQAPFHLSDDPMMRATLIKLAAQEHILALTVHHIACDGWSLSILVKELTELYSAYTENRPVRLPDLEIQYADYAIWQRNYLQRKLLEEKMSYWKKKLQDVAQLQMPTDYLRPATQSIRGAVTSFRLDKQLTQQLHLLSRRHDATLFMTLLTVFKILLHRYSGQADICIGTPVANRNSKETEGLIGFFVNTLIVRSQVSGDDTFTKLLQQVKTTILEAFQHQEVPFEKIVDTVLTDRDMSRNPLFQVMFILQNTPDIPALHLGELQLTTEPLTDRTSKFDFTFSLLESAYGIQASVEYCTDLFSEATIVAMAGHYLTLLQSVVNKADEVIALLPMAAESEIRQVLVEFNNTAVQYPADKTIVALFEEQVLRTPDNTAVIFEHQHLTYKELNEKANRLAHYLKTKGVQPETLVPVCIERSLQMITGILGILKAGGAYVPVDPGYPAERIQYMLDDIASPIVLSNRKSSSALAALPAGSVIMLDDESYAENQPSGNLNTGAAPANAAYVIYTSGSTGKPKGVINQHDGLVNRLLWAQSQYGLTPGDSVLQKTTFSFDVSVWELLWPLLTGTRLVFARPDGHKDQAYLKQMIQGQKIKLLHFVPSMLQVFLNDVLPGECNGLKTVLCSGEALTPAQVNLFRKKLPGVALHNLYGPTEAAIDVTSWSIPRNSEADISVVPIGKPVANTQMYILDQYKQPVPVGIAGELFISGVQVARGYLNQPALTAEKFLAGPFSRQPGARMYRTGDTGRWLPDGNIEYLGRKDEQVKVRGFRIELNEVENAVNSLESVAANCVVAKKDVENSNKLVNYYVPDWKMVKEKEASLYAEQVAGWNELYESEYGQTEAADAGIDPEFNLVGWVDSFTGHPIPPAQMAEWLSDIVAVIRPEQAGDVLEIGSGTGLIYYPLAGKVKSYTGTDFSLSSIRQIQNQIRKGQRNYGPTELYACAAHNVSLLPGHQVDTIIINSVAQYFPGRGYMDAVIANSLSLLKEEGRLIIGDVRDLRSLSLFKSRLQLQKMKPSISIADFKWAVEQEVLKEEELCFSPGYFFDLAATYPQIAHVAIQWKQNEYVNELTAYRYNVIIYIGTKKELLSPEWIDWNETAAEQMSSLLQQAQPVIACKNVPNPRLQQEQWLNKAFTGNTALSVGDLIEIAGQASPERTEKEPINQLLQKARLQGYHCRLLINEDPLLLDIVFEKQPGEYFMEQLYTRHSSPVAEKANVPLFGSISLQMQKNMREQLKQKLPDYMVPTEFVALRRLPLTPNGKADRQFLSRQEGLQATGKLSYAPPVTALEQQLVAIWQELLGLDRVGIHDNFFELGGHSLLAMKMVAHLKKSLHVAVPVQVLFQFATVSTLSNYLQWQMEAPVEEDAMEVINI